MDGFINWLVELDPVFAFLLSLPFLVGAAAFCGDAVRSVWRHRTGKERRAGESGIQSDRSVSPHRPAHAD